MEKIIDKKIDIKAPAAEIWKSLTDTTLMAKWMGDAALDLDITTSWQVGAPIIIKGFHHARFENKGVVLEYLPDQILSYNFLSSLSRLPDKNENYTIIRFTIIPMEQHTSLELSLTNFPTDVIYHHLNFYWNTTLVMLKRAIEQ